MDLLLSLLCYFKRESKCSFDPSVFFIFDWIYWFLKFQSDFTSNFSQGNYSLISNLFLCLEKVVLINYLHSHFLSQGSEFFLQGGGGIPQVAGNLPISPTKLNSSIKFLSHQVSPPPPTKINSLPLRCIFLRSFYRIVVS